MPDPLSAAVIAQLRSLRSAGRSIAQIVVQTGISRPTVIKHTRDIVDAVCGCGRPAKHGGFCAARPVSDHQRAVRGRLGGCNKKWTTEANALLREEWPKGTLNRAIIALLVARPGFEGITVKALQIQAHDLGLKRPEGFMRGMTSDARQRNFEREKERRLDVIARLSAVSREPIAEVATPPAPKQPFRMMSMQGPDPRRPALLAAKARSSFGRV